MTIWFVISLFLTSVNVYCCRLYFKDTGLKWNVRIRNVVKAKLEKEKHRLASISCDSWDKVRVYQQTVNYPSITQSPYILHFQSTVANNNQFQDDLAGWATSLFELGIKHIRCWQPTGNSGGCLVNTYFIFETAEDMAAAQIVK